MSREGVIAASLSTALEAASLLITFNEGIYGDNDVCQSRGNQRRLNDVRREPAAAECYCAKLKCANIGGGGGSRTIQRVDST